MEFGHSSEGVYVLAVLVDGVDKDFEAFAEARSIVPAIFAATYNVGIM
jgi:hypothetical protein